MSKKISKKMLAFVLTVCLMSATFTAFAFRVSAGQVEAKAELTVNGVTTQYSSFEDALQAATGDATITLLKDATYSPIVIMVGTDYSLHSLTLTSRGEATLTSSTDAAGFITISSGGVLNFDGTNLTIIGACQTFTVMDGTFNMKNGKLQGLNNAENVIRVDSGNINMSGGILEGGSSVIDCGGTSSVTVHLSGGKIIANANLNNRSAVGTFQGTVSIYLSGGNNLTLQNGDGSVAGLPVNSGVNIYGKDGDSSFTGNVIVMNNGKQLGEIAVRDASKDANYIYSAKDKLYSDYSIERSGANFVVCKGTQFAPTELKIINRGILGTLSSMEYAATENPTTWNPCTSGITSVGVGTWYVRYKETATKKAGVATKVIVVPQLAQYVTLNQKDIYLTKGKKVTLQVAVAPCDTTNPVLSWTSSNNNVATVDASGNVTAIKNGTTVITATTTDGSGVSAQCSMTVGYIVNYKCNGGMNMPDNPVVVTGKNKVKIKSPIKPGYAFGGWYTDKKLTKGISAIGKGTNSGITLYAKWEKVKVDKSTIRDLTNLKKKKMNVSFDKVDGATGYEVLYSTDKKFTKNATTITTDKLSQSMKGLEKGKKYYVKVRAYKLDSMGIKVYGKYSGVMSVKIIK